MKLHKIPIIEDDDVLGLIDATKDIIENGEIPQVITNKGIVEFNTKEIQTMPKTFRKLLLIQKNRCRLRTHASGKNTITYEIRLRRNGYDISASGKTIELAKQNFINKLQNAKMKSEVNEFDSVPKTFNAFSIYYFDNFRREKVAVSTMKNDFNRYKRYLQPLFKETPLNKITPTSCKSLLEKLREQGKGKTADEIHSLLNAIFKSAIAHNIIERNPLDIVLHISHERESGKALTIEEEKHLETTLAGSNHQSVIMLALCTGLRPNELKTARIDGNFIVAVNSKRKVKGKVEYKKIPIINKLKPYIDNLGTIPSIQTLRNTINKILPNHKLYDLRTTFYTRCVEYKINEIALKLFMGHSLGALGNAYTDVPLEFLLKEIEPLQKW